MQFDAEYVGDVHHRRGRVPIYNVSARPVFPEPIGAALFYLGLLDVRVALEATGLRVYADLVCHQSGSRHGDTVLAQLRPHDGGGPVPFVFVGLGMQVTGQGVNGLIGKLVNWWNGQSVNRSIGQVSSQSKRHRVISSREAGHLVTVFFILVLTFNAVLTYRDYFLDWPRGDYVRFWQQATWTQAVRAINADPASTPIAASGLSIQDFDPQTFELLGMRPDVKVKWFDCRNAIVYPGGVDQRRAVS